MLKKDKKHNLVGRTGIILSSGVAKDCFLVRKIGAVLRGGWCSYNCGFVGSESSKS